MGSRRCDQHGHRHADYGPDRGLQYAVEGVAERARCRGAGAQQNDDQGAEKQLISALPKMAKAAKNDQLSAGFQEHLEQTKEHATRLEEILKNRKQSTRGAKCKGMEGLIAEGAARGALG